MRIDLKADVHHLARVEGHGNIHVSVKDGRVEQARWDIVETPRFFEAILVGKHYTSAGILTARICGICSIGHCLASVRATERAFGVEVPDVASRLRLLAKHGETLQSHLLHLVFLAAPDFLGLPSALPLAQSHPELFARAARLKGLANRLCDVVAGRTTHPVSIQVGGMARFPDRKALETLRQELREALDDLLVFAELFEGFELPSFERETEFVSLRGDGEYPWIGGRLCSSDGVQKPEDDYLAMSNEHLDEHNTSKWCRLSRPSFAVGALARFNNNHALLQPEARRIAERFGLAPVCHNPFMNNVAQLVECVHVALEAGEVIDELLGAPPRPRTMAEVEPVAGEGVAAVEVPRGILYHHLVYDERGRVVRANCVIPTTQNNKNIHLDLGALVDEVKDEPEMTDERLTQLVSMLVRAYDPCISCSVH